MDCETPLTHLCVVQTKVKAETDNVHNMLHKAAHYRDMIIRKDGAL